METVQIIALTLGAAWASGINLYAAVFMLGLLGRMGYADLPPDLELLTDPIVIIASGLMYCVEFFADKTPGVDTGWDAIHSFIRIPAGAALAWGAVGHMDPSVQFAAFLVGGTLAAATHSAKAGTRVLINTSPEPFTNWTASVSEDVLVVFGLWAALFHPWVFMVGLTLFVLLLIWLLPLMWNGIKDIFRFLSQRFGRDRTPADTPQA